MSNSTNSIQPVWEENETRSPETLPPGFENPNPLPTPTSPRLENIAVSLYSSSSLLRQENQVTPTRRPPSPPPSQKIQSCLPLKSPPENYGPLPHSIQPQLPPPQESSVSLCPPLLPVQRESVDTVAHSPLQPKEGQDHLFFPQLPQGNSSFPFPPPRQSLPEMGQLVCGNCNMLLSYPRDSKYIQCACCQTTNFVLEAHQVGIANCGKCFLLLMYPYTAKSLRCSSCDYVTEISPHNLRPPVSVLQGFPATPQKGFANPTC